MSIEGVLTGVVIGMFLVAVFNIVVKRYYKNKGD